ncbi:hypothetical protein Tco_1477247 [Tanacetum coccineum]
MSVLTVMIACPSDNLCVSNSMNDVKFRANLRNNKILRKIFGKHQKGVHSDKDIFGDLRVVQIVALDLDSVLIKHMTGDRTQLTISSVNSWYSSFRNDQVYKDNGFLESLSYWEMLLFQGFITLKDMSIIYIL